MSTNSFLNTKPRNFKPTKKNDFTVITDKRDIANALAKQLAYNSSSKHCSEQFVKHKRIQEKKKINFSSSNNEFYNKAFSTDELKSSLNRAHDTAEGPDKIHYQLLKHLPADSMSLLLDIYNYIWQSGDFPPCWSEATVIPIPKPGKDHSDPNNYRPISLTRCVCKTLERMINDRLIWYLEHNNILTDIQCGFRKRKSTVDHLVRLESFIRDAFLNKQEVVSVFFDLEKAYDTTWKHGILKDLFDAGLRGRMPVFISKFLENRNFRVRLGSTLSDHFGQEMGVPQGSILSVTLFSLKINSLAKVLSQDVQGSLYVDEFLMSYRAKSTKTCERQLQGCLRKIEECCILYTVQSTTSTTHASWSTLRSTPSTTHASLSTVRSNPSTTQTSLSKVRSIPHTTHASWSTIQSTPSTTH